MIRLLPCLVADGPTQMALDEALLEHPGPTTVRLYRWSPPAVSLGYFQDYRSIAATIEPLLSSGMIMVRRITGGGAIWHQHEVTYSIVGELGRDGLPLTTKQLYPLIHNAVLSRLAQAGARLDVQAQTVGDRRYAEEPRCFASPAADDLVHADGGKVLGSAARARGRRVLLHGSLKLASNPWDRDAVAPCGVDEATAAAALEHGISAALAQKLAPGSLTTAEELTCQRIRAERYGNDCWVRERIGPRA